MKLIRGRLERGEVSRICLWSRDDDAGLVAGSLSLMNLLIFCLLDFFFGIVCQSIVDLKSR